MAARIDRGRAQLLTRAGRGWTEKYPSGVAHAGQGRGEDGLSRRRAMRRGPSFSQIQSASDGERGVRLVYNAFDDLLHLDGRDTPAVPLI